MMRGCCLELNTDRTLSIHDSVGGVSSFGATGIIVHMRICGKEKLLSEAETPSRVCIVSVLRFISLADVVAAHPCSHNVSAVA